ncbi:hypothetical protein [Streptomyces sp. NBC_01373]|uniref:hypothetical protein n=1 Tax=Streptomyces sp. NBC_01373 TaxID=2903843 RepID=UPI00225272FB|nr:hypothetical protein [Streptomyces sp. NBC_01373]MCX4697058.1 hypothetical protein [Streptomyces sp. NBC_01373]MCX4707017.1 hypothetical protein [Streptomyces sp. NBC_01373]
MTVNIAAVDVSIPVLTLQVAASHTASPSERIAYCLDEWLVSHPNAPVSVDADYPQWAAELAAQPTYFRPLEAS